MASQFAAIPPHNAALIHGTKMQDEPLPFRKIRKIDRPPVPESLSRLQCAANTGPHRLRGEGDKDFSVRFVHGFSRRTESILPPSVQALPVPPPKLGSWVFRQRHRIRPVLFGTAPDCTQLMYLCLLLFSQLKRCNRVFDSHLPVPPDLSNSKQPFIKCKQRNNSSSIKENPSLIKEKQSS